MKMIHLLMPVLVFLLCTLSMLDLHGQSTCAPILTYDNGYDLCGSSGTLSLTISVGIPNGCAYSNMSTPYHWQGPGTPGMTDDNQISILNPSYGDYSVQIILVQSPIAGSPSCPCIGVHTSNIVSVNPTPAMPNVTSDTISCGGITVLRAVAPNGGPLNGFFNWYNLNDDLLFSGSAFTTPPLNSTTSYKVSYVANGCESAKRTFSVIVNPLPQPLVTNDTISCNNSTTLFAISPSGSAVYWYADISLTDLVYIGSQFTTPSLISTKTYYAVSTNGNCFSSPVPVSIYVSNTSAPITSTVQVCQGDEVTLTAQHGSTLSGSGTFEWYNSNNLLIHSGNQFRLPNAYTSNPGNLTLYVLDNNNGCKSSLVLQNIEVLPKPEVSVTSSFIKVCENALLELSATSPNDPNVTYSWQVPWDSTLIGNSQVFPQATRGTHDGKFQVSVENTFGCMSQIEQIIVQVVPAPNLGLLPFYHVQDGEEVSLSASGADSYFWSPTEYFENPSVPNPQFIPPTLTSANPDSIQVILEGHDVDNNCVTVDTTIVIVSPYEGIDGDIEIRVYEVITPNEDGFNDVWYIDYLYNLPEYTILLFDSRNRLVYHFKGQGDDYSRAPWDGKVFDKKEPAPTGTYRYVIEYPGMPNPITGYLTVLSK